MIELKIPLLVVGVLFVASMIALGSQGEQLSEWQLSERGLKKSRMTKAVEIAATVTFVAAGVLLIAAVVIEVNAPTCPSAEFAYLEHEAIYGRPDLDDPPESIELWSKLLLESMCRCDAKVSNERSGAPYNGEYESCVLRQPQPFDVYGEPHPLLPIELHLERYAGAGTQ